MSIQHVYSIKLLTKTFIQLLSLAAVVILLRLFVFDLYRVPSNSMEHTLVSGDYIIVSKLTYGPRVVKVWKLFIEKRFDYRWYKGLDRVRKGDVVVFNVPQYFTLSSEAPNMFGIPYVKRCFSLSGDSVVIKDKEYTIKKDSVHQNVVKTVRKKTRKEYLASLNNDIPKKTDLYPHDSTLNWTADNYGPLFIPCKGKTIQLSAKIANHYKDILMYEGYKTSIRGDSVFLNNIYTTNYTFTENYYFMLGDNFYRSQDSRYWGFVPQKNIIGKVVFVCFSLDPDKPWYSMFRWNRFLKRVK